MFPDLRYRLRILPILFLFSLTTLAQSNDSLRFGRHTLSLNLTPGIRREVQLFFEWPTSPTLSLEMVAGVWIPSTQRDYDMVLGTFTRSYDERYQVLPYERGWFGGVNWKKYPSRNHRGDSSPSFHPVCFTALVRSTTGVWAKAAV
jgi:hypothetical protein